MKFAFFLLLSISSIGALCKFYPVIGFIACLLAFAFLACQGTGRTPERRPEMPEQGGGIVNEFFS